MSEQRTAENDAPCRICRRPEYEHRDRNSHGYVIPPASTEVSR